MNMALSELLDAFEYSNTGNEGDLQAFINRRTHEVYYGGDEAITGAIAQAPADLDEDYWLAMPRQNKLDLGAHLPLRFAESLRARDRDEIQEMFRRKGAYKRFRAK